MGKKLLGVLVTAIALFLWGFVSWALLGWHQAKWKSFTDEQALAATLKANAPQAGFYVLPAKKPGEKEADYAKRWDAGPVIMGTVRTAPTTSSMPLIMAKNFLLNLLTVCCIGFLLTHTATLSYGRKVKFGAVLGLVIGLVAVVPSMLWFETPWDHSLLLILDHVITATIACAVLGKFMCPT